MAATSLALHDVRVLETATHLMGPFAGRLLGSLGATVLKAESSSGDTLRNVADGTLFAYLNAGKQSIATDDPGDIERLARGAHIWIDARPLDQIRASHEALREEERPLVHVAVTPFGLRGPWAGREATGIVAAAMGGFMHLCGDPTREPLKNGGYLPEFQAGLFAAIGSVAGLLALESGRPGPLEVDVSLLEAVIAFQERADMALVHQGRDWIRSRRHEVGHPFTIFECADGFVSLAVGMPRHWANLAVLIGKPEWAEDPEIVMNRLAHADMIDEALEPWLKEHPVADVVRMCQELFIPCGPVLSADEVLEDAHHAERKFFTTMALPGNGEIRVPGSPLRAPWASSDLPPSPALGEHNARWLGAAV